jgi:uncharacterized protein (DUF433 family)
MATGTSPESRPRVSVEHIEIDERGNAKLAGHRIKVKHLVGLMQAHGYTAEQVKSEAYPHLSLAQIHAALAYYYDHQAEIDRRIAEDDAFVEQERQKQLGDPKYQELMARMRARWADLKSQEASAKQEGPND